MKSKILVETILKKSRIVILLFLITIIGCTEKIDNANLYTFTGETIEDYLINRSETFSDFNYILKRADLDQLLSAYGVYTCFAPTNEAVEIYVDSLYDDTSNNLPHNGMTERSIKGLTDSLCIDIAKYHLSNSKVLTTDMNSGTTISTMLGRDLTTSVDSLGQTRVNTYSVIISLDNEVENGVIQVIDNVLHRSNRQMAGELEQHPEYSIFYQALIKTGLADSLIKTKKKSLNSVTNNITNYWVPDECKYGYTIFAETNDVFYKNGINNLNDLINYADSIYNSSANVDNGWYDYFRDNGIKVSTGTDYTARNNVLNMFVSYHLLKYSVPYSNLVYSRNQVNTVSLFEYYETMLPYTLFKITRYSGNLYINRYQTNNTLTNIVAKQGDNHTLIQTGVLISNEDIAAMNGYIHPINNLLIYNSRVPKGVLNERMRFEDTSFLPEMMSNSIRGMTSIEIKGKKGGESSTDGNEWVRFPGNYFDNLVVYNGENTQLRYLPGREANWDDYQMDEFLCIGAYDFAFRLPPVPDGTYELRMGYAANASRGMVQFYLGKTSKQADMKAIDIPLDMRIIGTDANIGWTLWSSEDDQGIATDKEMHNRGYMRGPLYFTLGIGGASTSRDQNNGLRRIIAKQQFKQGEYWLRFKTVLPDNSTTQFHLDYIEFCPANVYNNSTYVEDMY